MGRGKIRAAQLIWAESFGSDRRCRVAKKLASELAARRRASVVAMPQNCCRSFVTVEAAARRLIKMEKKLDEMGTTRKFIAFEYGALLPPHPSKEVVAAGRQNTSQKALVALAKKKKLTKDLALPAGALEQQVGCALLRLLVALGPCSRSFIRDE